MIQLLNHEIYKRFAICGKQLNKLYYNVNTSLNADLPESNVILIMSDSNYYAIYLKKKKRKCALLNQKKKT